MPAIEFETAIDFFGRDMILAMSNKIASNIKSIGLTDLRKDDWVFFISPAWDY